MTIRWALDFALVGITLIVIALCFAAIGAAVRRALGSHTRTLDDGFLAFWLGFSAVTWFLILWNFAFPIDSTAVLVVALASGVCLLASGWSLGHDGRSHLTHPRSATIVTLLVAAAWVTSQCLAPFQSWDGVLYHIQGVAWAKAHPAIPGIANLHGPLAFNNSSFLYDALVDSWLWETRGFHLANGALLLAAVLQGASAGLRWWRHKNQTPSVRLFEFLLLPIALYYSPEVATYSTDLPMALTLSVAIARSYAFLQEPRRNTPKQTPVVLAVLFSAAVVMKLTAAVFVATALVVMAWRDLRNSDGASGRLRAWVWGAVAVLVYIGPWIARGLILSGYPLFPLPYFGIDVDWRAPLEHARAEVVNITFTEREFSWHFVGRAWVYLTFVRNVAAILLPSLLTAFACFRWWRLRRGTGIGGWGLADWLLVLPALAGIAGWLPSAPSHRYAPVLFWTLAAVSLSAWLLTALRASKMKFKSAWMAAMAIGISPLVVSTGSTFLLDGPVAGMHSLRQNVIGALGSDLTALPTDFPTQPFVTTSGLVLNTPAPRANTADVPNACGNAPLPCTANPAPNLELRFPGNLEKGFRVRGEWQMVNFPYPWRPTFLKEWRARENDRK